MVLAFARKPHRGFLDESMMASLYANVCVFSNLSLYLLFTVYYLLASPERLRLGNCLGSDND